MFKQLVLMDQDGGIEDDLATISVIETAAESF